MAINLVAIRIDGIPKTLAGLICFGLWFLWTSETEMAVFNAPYLHSIYAIDRLPAVGNGRSITVYKPGILRLFYIYTFTFGTSFGLIICAPVAEANDWQFE